VPTAAEAAEVAAVAAADAAAEVVTAEAGRLWWRLPRLRLPRLAGRRRGGGCGR
jgi:hypothetical protein